MSPLGPFARTEADAPAPGEIPGLRGAPMRTPVRTTEATTGPGLWPAVVGRMLTRQLWIELYGLPGYALTLKGRVAQGFAATPAISAPSIRRPGRRSWPANSCSPAPASRPRRPRTRGTGPARTAPSRPNCTPSPGCRR